MKIHTKRKTAIVFTLFLFVLHSCGPVAPKKSVVKGKLNSAVSTTESAVLTDFKKDLSKLVTKGAKPQFGMLYSIWHCMATRAPHNTRISEAKDTGQWGGLSAFHWRDKPAVSAIEDYCLARNSNLAVKHLEMIRDLGVQFIVVDLTNQCFVEGDAAVEKCSFASLEMVNSYLVLVEATKKVANSPKIVPWVPFKGTLVDRVIQSMDQNPQANYFFEGKPLIIATWDKGRDFHIGVDTKINQVKLTKTVKKMWGLTGASTDAETWSFMDSCTSGFREAKGNRSCGQWGNSEMTPVATAYQETFMTNFQTATPKFEGRTMLEQLKTALERQSKIILFNWWNEWIAQRFCYNTTEFKTVSGRLTCPTGVSELSPQGNATFVDLYDSEYGRDIEPDEKGDHYYQLLKSAISSIESASVGEPSPLPVPTSNYSEIRSVNASQGNVPGQTGSWWCSNHFGNNFGGKWDCLSDNCNKNVQMNEKIDCGKFSYKQTNFVNASIGDIPGQTGSWWCKNHFGNNIGGNWECYGNNCNANVKMNERVECGLR